MQWEITLSDEFIVDNHPIPMEQILRKKNHAKLRLLFFIQYVVKYNATITTKPP